VPRDLGRCASIAAGDLHTVALLADGTVRAWGDNQEGQIDVPRDLRGCSSVAAGYFVSLATVGPRLPDSDADGWPNDFDNCPTVANRSQADCNSDGVGDACEIVDGAQDYNLNGIPDICECIGDLFPNGTVNGADLGILLSEWGPAPLSTVSDLNRDGSVDGSDLGYLLSSWGPCR
jgi:hypothetical protein